MLSHFADSDLFKYRGTNNADTTSNNPETIVFESLDDTSYAALCVGRRKTSNEIYSCTSNIKTTTSFDIKTEHNAGTSSGLTGNHIMAIPYGDYELNSTTHIECGTEGSGNSWDPTLTTAFLDTNYAILCTPFEDADTPTCISYNDGSQKITSQFRIRTFDDTEASETVTGVDWCAISYGSWNLSNAGGEDIVVQAGVAPIASWDNVETVTLYTPMPSSDFVVMLTHEDNDLTDPATCNIVTPSLTTQFQFECVDDDGGTGGSSEFVYWMAISQDGAANLTKTEEVEEFAWNGTFWEGNITMPNFASGTKDLYVEVTESGNNINSTETNAIDYGEAPEDTCTYISGDWNVDCSDNCVISSPVSMPNNDLNIVGTGTFSTSADIDVKKFHQSGSCVVHQDGGYIK